MADADDRLIDKMTKTATAIRGPGMATTISSRDLDGLLHILKSRLTVAPVAPVAKRGKAAKAQAVEAGWTAPLAEVIPVLAEIIEAKTELWGQPLVEALGAWAAQTGIVLPEAWVPAVNRALSGG